MGSKIRESANGQDCTIRIPGFCNFDPETTVLCHLRYKDLGMGKKANDIHGAYGCSACHAIVDGVHKTYHTKEQIKIWFYDGMVRTQLLLIEQGIL